MMTASSTVRQLDETSAAPAALRDQSAASRPSGSRKDSRRQLWLARALLTGALLIASYLAYFSLTGGALPGCRPEEGCSDALSSARGYWLGMPVSIPAAVLYLALLAVSFAVERRPSAPIRRRLWLASLALGSTSLAAAVWFIGLQAFVLEQWCTWCTVTHCFASAAAAIMIHLARTATRSRERILRPREVASFAAGAAALCWALLAVGKHANAPPAAAATAMVPSSSAQPEAGRTIVLHQGRFKLNPAELPLVGPANAKAILVGLFDTTCHHCRETRRVVRKAIERAAGRLAIISLPMPLDKQCNHLVSRTSAQHAHACEYGALALGVYRAKPAAFVEFEDWLFEPVDPPSIEQARSKAVKLVGGPALSRALGDPWIGARLVEDILLYEANAQASGGDTRLPQVVIGDTLVRGVIGSPDDLFQLLARHAGSSAR